MNADYRKDTIENQFVNWKNKPIHGQYLKNIETKVDLKTHMELVEVRSVKERSNLSDVNTNFTEKIPFCLEQPISLGATLIILRSWLELEIVTLH